MSLRLILLRGKKVLWEIPLSTEDWTRDDLDGELEDLETEFDSLSKVFDALSNRNRLMIMKNLLGEEGTTLTFSDMMRGLNMNPKIVRESTTKLSSGGLLEQTERGRYACPRAGQASFLTLTVALRRLLLSLEEE